MGQSRGRAAVIMTRRPVVEGPSVTADDEVYFRVPADDLIQQTLTVGGLGAADMTVQNGARVVSGRGVIGQASPGIGQVTVSGSGSLLACTGYGDLALTVGDFGQGTLDIADGAVVVSGRGYIGKQASGTQ